MNLVQSGTMTAVSSAADSSQTFASNPTNGNLIIVTVGGQQGNAGTDFNTNFVQDNKSNTYTRRAASHDNANFPNCALYEFVIPTNANYTSYQVTVKGSQGGGGAGLFFTWNYAEIGGGTAAPFDVSATNNSAGVTATGGNSGTTAAPSGSVGLAFAVVAMDGNSANEGFSTPTNYTEFYQHGGTSMEPNAADYRLASLSGAQSAAWTWTDNKTWAALIVLYDGASASTSPVGTIVFARFAVARAGNY